MSNAALARLEAFKVSLFVNLGNLISISSGVLLMGDHWSQAQTIGSICMLAGVIGANYRGRKVPDNTEFERSAKSEAGAKSEADVRLASNAESGADAGLETRTAKEHNVRKEVEVG